MAASFAPAARAQAGPDWRFADPNASMIGGIDVQSVLQSSLVKTALAQVTAKFGGAVPGMAQTLGTLGGVSQVYFSLSGHHDSADVLVLMKGNLSDELAKAFIQGANMRGATRGKTGTPGGEFPKIDMRRIDANTILYGDVALLDAAMRRLSLPASTTPNPLMARAKALSAGNDFWIGGSLPNIPAVALVGASLRSLAVGLSLQQDFRFQVSLDMATAELAQTLAAEARKSIEEAQQQNKIDAKKEIEVTGTTLRMKISMDMDKLSKLVADKLADVAPMAGPVSGPGPSSTSPNRTQPEPQEARPQQPKSIKIYGLDDGPKEIPLSRP
jgi:hypothetical protein